MATPTRILVVDDNEDCAELLAAVFELRGHELRIAHDAAAALAIARQFLPEVAFLDLGLPGIDGCELAQALRALPGLAAIRLIALTGSAEPAARVRTRQAGFADHLVKPVGFATLEAALIGPPMSA